MGKYWLFSLLVPLILKKFFFFSRHRSRYYLLYGIASFAFALILGIWHYNNNLPPTIAPRLIGKEIQISGKVIALKKSKTGQNIILQAENNCTGSDCLKYYFIIRPSALHISDKLNVKGKIALPKNSPAFDFRAYLQRFGVNYIIENPQITGHREIKSIYSLLGNFKNNIEETINNSLPYPHNSLLIGLLTGSRNSLPAKTTEDFNKLGLTHVLAISGYNITIIITILGQLLFFINKLYRTPLILIGIGLFTIFVGADPPVIRAAIMGSLTVLALSLGHKTNLINSILFSAVIMYWVDTQIITKDISFQLSFAATLGVIYLSPKIKERLQFITDKLSLRENLSLTLAAQITTAPVSLYHFGTLSLIAPLSNILVLPLIPLCMAGGFTALLFNGIINQPALLFTPVHILLSMTLEIVDLLAKIPIGLLKV